MPGRVQGNEYRITQVCVDDRQDGRFSGRLYNPYWEGGVPFSSVMEFLTRMEELLDQMQFPQSFAAVRSFQPAPRPAEESPPEPGVQEGKLGTFVVRVIFRQNASWQGSVSWLEGRRDESCRSVLELLMLLNSALEQEKNRAS